MSVLRHLTELCADPHNVMRAFADWLIKHQDNRKLIEAAAPIKFDGAFTAFYFNTFYTGENPLGFSGEDINSLYRGVTRNPNAHIKNLGLRQGELPHNALEDAIIQAREMQAVLELMRRPS